MYRMLVVFCIAAAAFGQRSGSVIPARFIGSWDLVSYELRLPSGAITKPFGDRPVGRILYQRNGQMSAQLMQPVAPPFRATIRSKRRGKKRNAPGVITSDIGDLSA